MILVLASLLFAFPPTVLTSASGYDGSGDCQIKELTVTTSDCDADGKFTMTIDFDVENPGNNGFKVWNGAFYGEYDYTDLPITIGPFPGDCHTTWEINVKDFDFPHCFAQKVIGKKCCNGGGGESCKIKELALTTGDCDEDGNFWVVVNFVVENPGPEGFKIVGNGNNYGDFDYADVPVILGPLSGDCKTNYEFAVKDLVDPNCHAAGHIGKICCEGDPGTDCKIKELTAHAGECDENGKFFVELDFDVDNPGDNGFKVFGNGHNYGVFNYADLPLLLGPLPGDCKTEWEFAVKDLDDPHCFAAVDIGKKCCNGEPSDCTIKEASVKFECENDTFFYAIINFEVNNPGGLGYTVSGNGHHYGDFEYSDLPLVLGPFLADCHTNYFFFIEDKEKEKCHKELVLGKVCCVHEEKCEVKGLHATIGDCSSDSTYWVTVHFELKNGEPGFFDLWFNGHLYGEYHTDDLPLSLEVFAGKNAKDMVKVCMKDPKHCCATIYFHPPTCLHNGKEIAHHFYPHEDASNGNHHYFEGDTRPFLLHIYGQPFILTPLHAWQIMEEVTVCDMAGHPVFNARTPNQKEGALNIDHLMNRQPGIYIVTIRTDKAVETFKIFLAQH